MVQNSEVLTVPPVSIPAVFNAATYFVDANLERGRGDHPAIICEDKTYTYNQVAETVNRFGNALLNLGFQLEQRLLVVMLDCPEYAAAFFGTMKIGAVPVPTNTLLRPPDYTYLLNDSKAVGLIVSSTLLPILKEAIVQSRYLKHVIIVGDEELPEFAGKQTHSFSSLVASASPALAAEPTSKDDMAFWLYSSGTTGFPKGAVHRHQDMVYSTEYYAKPILGINENDRTFSVAKLFFAYGLGNGLYFPFAVGATTVLLPGRPEPAKVFEICQIYQPTLFFSVPTNYAALLALSETNPETYITAMTKVRWGVSAGEALPKHIWERFYERFGVKILDGIGSTEILHIFISNREGAIKPGSSGLLVPGYEAKILDENGQEADANQEGMLWIKGDSTAVYYWNKWEKSKATMVGEWIATGDRYSRDEAGFYWYHGRNDDMIKAGGIWVSPVEVENALSEHDAVVEVGVVGMMDADDLVKPYAYVVLKEGYLAGVEIEAALKQYLKNKIAHYKAPRWIEFVDVLPRTATGKLQRFKLRKSG
jgi:benzoate-CoA ligase family protein